jgi:hypothetical protein
MQNENQECKSTAKDRFYESLIPGCDGCSNFLVLLLLLGLTIKACDTELKVHITNETTTTYDE